jgi:RNA polymerase sigma-70 factor, ECF subfamily
VKDPDNLTGGTSRTASRLVEGLKARDGDAWRQLAALYGPLVYGWCRRAGLRDRDAEDVVQEVFLVVLRRVGEFRHDRPGGTFRGWLRAIARNKLGDWIQRQPTRDHAAGGTDAQERLNQLPADEPPADPTREVGGLYQRALELVRPEFEERSWQAFWRTAVGGEDAATAAAALGLTPNAVYVAKSRILRRLREVLGDV